MSNAAKKRHENDDEHRHPPAREPGPARPKAEEPRTPAPPGPSDGPPDEPDNPDTPRPRDENDEKKKEPIDPPVQPVPAADPKPTLTDPRAPDANPIDPRVFDTR